MKKLSFYSVLALALLTMSCVKDAPVQIPVLADTTVITNNLKSGTWHITKYIDHTENETNHFTGYNFTFGANGVLTASNGTLTFTGTWVVTNNQTLDDSPNNPIDVNISFPTGNVNDPLNYFADITDDWDIITSSSTKFQMIDVFGADTETDYITFEKII
jgi:hypothetical protein